MAENWIELAIGAWLLISPWVFGFAAITLMKWGNLFAGLIIVLINLWKIFGDKRAVLPEESAKGKM